MHHSFQIKSRLISLRSRESSLLSDLETQRTEAEAAAANARVRMEEAETELNR